MQSKKTKIVCTMGPATESEDVLRELIKAGMNVARFNFSHGSHDYHRAGVARVRKVSAELGIPVAILLDTKGPEVRTGVLENGEKVHFETGDKTIITTDDGVVGNHERFSLDFKNLPNEVKPGDASSSTTACSSLTSTPSRAPTSTARSPTPATWASTRA